MIAAAFASLVLIAPGIAQDPVPATSTTYVAPPVRPFEPPSDFGRETPQGDGASRPWRAPIAAPVTVDAYGGQYEAEPQAGEAAYAQGVAAAELSMDARMGPLDGRWTLVGEDGRPLMRLVLADPGSGARVEGAWRSAAGSGGGIGATFDDAGRATFDLEGGGALILSRTGEGWSGLLTDARGRDHRVRLIR